MRKSLLATMLLLFATSFVFVSCTEEEEFDNSAILGSWVSEDNTSYLTVTWSFFQNNTATERVVMKMGSYVIDDTTLSFTYDYKGSTIKLVSQSGEVLNYTISVNGNKMKLGNQEDGYFNLKRK